MWNIRYLQIIDAILGIATIDFCGDDGYPVGKWSFPRRSDDAMDDYDSADEDEEAAKEYDEEYAEYQAEEDLVERIKRIREQKRRELEAQRQKDQ